MKDKLVKYIEKERIELKERKSNTDYKPEWNYLYGRLDALDLLEKEFLDKE